MVIGAGIGAFNLLSGAVDMAIGSLGEAAQKFREDQVSVANLSQSLQNNIPSWDGNTAAVEAAAAAAEKKGFEDDAARAALGQLVGITHDQTAAVGLLGLAQDLARAKGLDLATATDVVTKAAQGQGRGLKGLGIDIAGATTAADLLAAAQKNVKGAADNWANTNEGKLAVSNVKVGEAMEKVGKIVDKVSQVVVPALADALLGVADVFDKVFTAVQPVISTIAKDLKPLLDTLANTVLPALSTAFETVFGALPNTVKGAINLVIGAINGFVDAINAIQIHIDIAPPIGPEIKFDWNGVGLGKLAYLHAGGIVPGTPGQDVPAILQAGERVIPAGQSASVINVNVQVSGTAIFDPYGQGAQRIAAALLPGLRRELTRQSMSLA